ncbi:MAG: hypothetical protein K2Q45_06765 [Nitrosomonas sp.]|nr:hypothetical protein [Nitrosomonas sp.]
MKLDRAKAILCRHIKSTAHWLSSRKINELKQLYKASPEDAIREFGGIVVSDYRPALRKEEIADCMRMESFITTHPPSYIFTACDPSGGGPSQLAIVSGYFTKLGDVVIIGMDAEPVRDDKEEYMLLQRHYRKLRENKMFREAKKIFIPENNLGLEAAHLDTMVADLNDVETFWQKPNKPGVNKDGKATRGYQFNLSLLLAEKGLRFDRDLFTVTREKTPQCMKDQLADQMYRFHWEKKKAADSLGKDRYALTGKSGSLQDDLLITLAMVIYWGRIIVRERERSGIN